jgi:hypothetical protein
MADFGVVGQVEHTKFRGLERQELDWHVQIRSDKSPTYVRTYIQLNPITEGHLEETNCWPTGG